MNYTASYPGLESPCSFYAVTFKAIVKDKIWRKNFEVFLKFRLVFKFYILHWNTGEVHQYYMKLQKHFECLKTYFNEWMRITHRYSIML